MTLREFIVEAEGRIGSDSSWLDAIVLTEWASGIRRERLLAELSRPLDSVLESDAAVRLDEAIGKRAAGVPVAYITGSREFYGRLFAVNPAVLIPRPETELLVERALEAAKKRAAALMRSVTIHDLCTGSGCVAVSLAAELHRDAYSVSMSDISSAALEVALENARSLLGYDLDAWVSDLGLLHPPRRFDVVTANPPYLSSSETRNVLSKGWGEPPNALDGGADGFEMLQRLARGTPATINPGGTLLVECAPNQVERLMSVMYEGGFQDVYSYQDLSGADRVVAGEVFGGTDHDS